MTDPFNSPGLTHVWGPSGSGKTLFAIAVAAPLSRKGHILWINMDGKWAFIESLRNNIALHHGERGNVSIVLAHGQALTTIRRINEFVKPETRLVVIDPISRVLDLSHENSIMWGRELFEEVLPILASLTMVSNISVMLINEVRMMDEETVPLFHNLFRKFCDHEFETRRTVMGISDVLADNEKVGELLLSDNGGLTLRSIVTKKDGDLNCSASPAFA